MSEKPSLPPLPSLTGKEEIIMLFSATTDEGDPFFAYIKLTTAKLGEFYQAQHANAPIDLGSLGEILETGWGETPPEDVQQRITEQYGPVFDSDAK